MQNEELNYQEIVTKMLEHQHHIFSHLEEMKRQGTLPTSLDHAMAAAQEWRDKVDGKTGPEGAITAEGPEKLSKALQENKDILTAHQVREADDYAALLDDLKKVL